MRFSFEGGIARSNFGGQLFLPPRHTDESLVVEPLTGNVRRFGNKISGREKAPIEESETPKATKATKAASGVASKKNKKGGSNDAAAAAAAAAVTATAAAAVAATGSSRPVAMYNTKAQQECTDKYFSAVRSPDTGCI